MHAEPAIFSGRVLLTGAAGNMGRLLRAELPRHGILLRSAGGRHPLQPTSADEDVQHGDLREPAVVDRLLQGVHTVVHMAGTSVERPLPEIIDNNLIALHELYEGARRHGVRRIVFASSNHAFGMHSVQTRLELDAPYRPDGLYGLSKAWGELMARMYWDKHGIEGIALRIGSCEKEPANPRHLSTWLSHEDTVQLLLCCIRAPAVGFMPVWGVSDNARSYWTPNQADAIGYKPQSRSEDHAGRVLSGPNPLDAVARQFQGGSFVSPDYTPPGQRPGDAAPTPHRTEQAP
jgi:uronate dehydrogenase